MKISQTCQLLTLTVPPTVTRFFSHHLGPGPKSQPPYITLTLVCLPDTSQHSSITSFPVSYLLPPKTSRSPFSTLPHPSEVNTTASLQVLLGAPEVSRLGGRFVSGQVAWAFRNEPSRVEYVEFVDEESFGFAVAERGRGELEEARWRVGVCLVFEPGPEGEESRSREVRREEREEREERRQMRKMKEKVEEWKGKQSEVNEENDRYDADSEKCKVKARAAEPEKNWFEDVDLKSEPFDMST